MDTLRADRVAATRNGVPVMPNLHALAEKSIWFHQAIAPASWTKPSVTSVLTGLYPATHRVEFGVQKPWVEGQRMVIQGLAPEKPTLLAFFSDAGYATAAVQTNVHLQGQYGFAAGCGAYQFARWASATEVTDRTLALARQQTQPFLLYAHYFDPHADYVPPEPHRSVFGPLPGLTPEEEDLLGNDYHQRYYLQKAKLDMGLISEMSLGHFSETAREHIRQLYDGECHYTDAELGRLVQTIRAEFPDTVIVITSDHGEEFWEHGGLGHAKTVFQELVNVPLVISVPGRAPRQVNTAVETIDIAPTLAALAGATPSPGWQGRDILVEPLEALPAYSETRSSFPEANLHRESVIDGANKLIRDVSKGTMALFDLSSDPGEQQDLSPSLADRSAALGTLLDTHNAAATAHPLAAIPPTEFGLDGTPEAQSTREQLEALGYLDTTKARPAEAPATPPPHKLAP